MHGQNLLWKCGTLFVFCDYMYDTYVTSAKYYHDFLLKFKFNYGIALASRVTTTQSKVETANSFASLRKLIFFLHFKASGCIVYTRNIIWKKWNEC